MNIIEQFLRKVSYKFPKGYPDINDKQDILLLEKILKDLLEVDYNILDFGDLSRRANRLKKVHFKIMDKEPFTTPTGEVILTYDKPEYAEFFKNDDASGVKNIGGRNINSFPFFKDQKGKKYSISDLLKTSDFGGRGAGSGTAAEDVALLDISRQIKELGSVNIVLEPGGFVYKGISEATTFRGTPKADFSLDAGDKELIFISHKDGKTPKDFQQYGGFTGLTDYPEVQKFIEDVREITGGEIKSGQAFKRKIVNEEIALKAVYGLDFGSSKFGLNNCQIVLQGGITLKALDDDTYLLGAHHKLLSPEMPTGEYTPYLYVRKGDRDNAGIKSARFGIFPINYRPAAQEI
jgi:hypothetical protein